MRIKIITAVTSIIAIVLVLGSLLFIKASKEPTVAYYTVKESYTDNSNTGIISDGEYLYDYDFNTGIKTNKRLAAVGDSTPALFLLNTDIGVSLNKDKDVSFLYHCTQEEISSYMNHLIKDKFKLISYDLCAEYMDYTFEGHNRTVRVIWNRDNTCYIFCVDARKNYTDPPYIIG